MGALLIVGLLLWSEVSPKSTRALLTVGGVLLFQVALFMLLRRPYLAQAAKTEKARRPLVLYAMLLTVVVLSAYSGVQFFVIGGQTPMFATAGTAATIQGETGPDTSGWIRGSCAIALPVLSSTRWLLGWSITSRGRSGGCATSLKPSRTSPDPARACPSLSSSACRTATNLAPG